MYRSSNGSKGWRKNTKEAHAGGPVSTPRYKPKTSRTQSGMWPVRCLIFVCISYLFKGKRGRGAEVILTTPIFFQTDWAGRVLFLPTSTQPAVADQAVVPLWWRKISRRHFSFTFISLWYALDEFMKTNPGND